MKPKTLTALIVGSLLVTIIGILWVALLRNGLVIPGKTNALYSLETAWTKQRVAEVLGYWADRMELAWKLNTVDLIMPFGYCAFFVFSILRLERVFPKIYGENKKLLVSLAVAPAAFDVFEGIMAYVWLAGSIDNITPVVVAITARLKFLIVLPFALFIIGSYLLWAVKKASHVERK